ncbi:MAG: hypothetical protein Q7S05_01675 [bacterium]|nr:hypothetical protein [bacterium]
MKHQQGKAQMDILLVGHGGAQPRLSAIAKALKKTPGSLVSCYFDGSLDYINSRHNLPRTDFLILGLSRASRDLKSPAHAVEEDIVTRATALRPSIGCCIVCDEDGHVSTPYLIKLGSKANIVVAHEQNPACNVTEICERALPLYIPDVISGADQIAQAIYDFRAA